MLRLDILKAKRAISGKTLEAICEESGLSNATVSGIFSGRVKNPSIGVLEKLCIALDMTLEEAFTEKNLEIVLT